MSHWGPGDTCRRVAQAQSPGQRPLLRGRDTPPDPRGCRPGRGKRRRHSGVGCPAKQHASEEPGRKCAQSRGCSWALVRRGYREEGTQGSCSPHSVRGANQRQQGRPRSVASGLRPSGPSLAGQTQAGPAWNLGNFPQTTSRSRKETLQTSPRKQTGQKDLQTTATGVVRHEL